MRTHSLPFFYTLSIFNTHGAVFHHQVVQEHMQCRMQAAAIVVFSAATGKLHYLLIFLSATHLHQY